MGTCTELTTLGGNLHRIDYAGWETDQASTKRTAVRGDGSSSERNRIRAGSMLIHKASEEGGSCESASGRCQILTDLTTGTRTADIQGSAKSAMYSRKLLKKEGATSC